VSLIENMSSASLDFKRYFASQQIEYSNKSMFLGIFSMKTILIAAMQKTHRHFGQLAECAFQPSAGTRYASVSLIDGPLMGGPTTGRPMAAGMTD